MTKRTKIGGLSVKCIKKYGLSGPKWPKISQHFVKFVEILEKSIFLPKIVTCLTIKCENEGSMSDKDVSGSFGDKEFVKIRGSLGESQLVKMGVFR